MRLGKIHSGNIKLRLLSYFILIALIPTSVISVFYYTYSSNMMWKSSGENRYKVLLNMQNSVDSKIAEISNVSSWIYVNNAIMKLMLRAEEKSKIMDSVKLDAISQLQTQMAYLPIAKYVTSLFILGDNGLDIRYGLDGSLINKDELKELLPEHRQETDRYGVSWIGMRENLTHITSNKYIFGQIRYLKNIHTGRTLGRSLILLNTNMFQDIIEPLEMNAETMIYLFDSNGRVIFTNQEEHIGVRLSEESYYQKCLNPEYIPYSKIKIDKKTYLMTHVVSNETGWILCELMPMEYVQEQSRTYVNTFLLMLVLSAAICVMMSVYISGIFSKPIQTIVEHVDALANGKFDMEPLPVWKNEIGVLSGSINQMQEDINQLLVENRKKERDKRILEIRMLQNQINPHFIYNTLNSVKLMAKMQGSTGIKNMISSLAYILHASLSNFHTKVSIEEELLIVEHYIYIQKIFYKGNISFEKKIEDERLLQYKILKFILQPIVENSILHGIVPADRRGMIELCLMERNHKIIFSITDNGIGIEESSLTHLLHKMGEVQEDEQVVGLNANLGVYNVNQRLKLVYGEEYGIKIESEEGRYTRVEVMIPMEPAETGREE